jgi:hypothetical protein
MSFRPLGPSWVIFVDRPPAQATGMNECRGRSLEAEMPATGPADIADGTLMPARSSGAVGYNVHAAVVGMVSQSMARTRDLP